MSDTVCRKQSFHDLGVDYKGRISTSDGKVKTKTQTISSNPPEVRFPFSLCQCVLERRKDPTPRL